MPFYFNVPSLLLNLYSCFYRIFIKMSGNPFILESDSKGNVSSSLREEMKFGLHSFPSISGGSESGIIILSGGSEIEYLFRESLSDETPSMNTTESSFPMESSGGGNLSERPISPFVMTEA